MTHRSNPQWSWLTALGGALVVGACAVGPDYGSPPAVDLGSDWIDAPSDVDSSIDLESWWHGLGDPVLARLVEEGVRHNLDARDAVLRIEEARAALTGVQARRVPSLQARAIADVRRLSENGVLPVDGPGGIERDDTIYDTALDVAWEVDLFGRVARSVESASARLDAAEEDARAVRVSVAAEVARTYFALQGAQRERAARDASIAALAQSHALAVMRVEAGDLPPADLDRVIARLEVARAALPAIEARQRGAALALGTLLGDVPEKELALERAMPVEMVWPSLPVGERADLLRRRPDVRASERRLAAATANVGVALAEQFPKLTISASGGFQALTPGDLWQSDSQVHSVGPLVSWRVFEGGRVRAEIRTAEVREQRAALAYEQAVLTALGEAERALSAYRHARDSIAAQRTAVAATARVHGKALQRLAAGDIAVTEALEVERDWQEALEREAQLVGQGADGLVAVFKALGGGWACSPACAVAGREASHR